MFIFSLLPLPPQRNIYDGFPPNVKSGGLFVSLAAAPPHSSSLCPRLATLLPVKAVCLVRLFLICQQQLLCVPSPPPPGVRSPDELPGFLPYRKVPFWMRGVFGMCSRLFSPPVNARRLRSLDSLTLMWKMCGSPCCVLTALQAWRPDLPGECGAPRKECRSLGCPGTCCKPL